MAQDIDQEDIDDASHVACYRTVLGVAETAAIPQLAQVAANRDQLRASRPVQPVPSGVSCVHGPQRLTPLAVFLALLAVVGGRAHPVGEDLLAERERHIATPPPAPVKEQLGDLKPSRPAMPARQLAQVVQPLLLKSLESPVLQAVPR